MNARSNSLSENKIGKTMYRIEQFHNQTFINLETFRKNGTGVKTPVWFVEDGEHFYVRTVVDSWKVKRIKNNSQVTIVPCTVQGEPLGEWVPAFAQQFDDPVREEEINKMFNHKYGLQKCMFDLMGKIRKQQITTLDIKLTDGY